MSNRDAKWNPETQSGTYSDKIHWGELKINKPVMSTIIVKTGEDRYCLVNGMDNVTDLQLHEGESSQCITYHVSVGTDNHNVIQKTFPPGNWQIVGIGRELSEDQWKEIVEMISKKEIDKLYTSYGFKNYKKENAGSASIFGSAAESGFSWLRSHGANETFLILKDNADKKAII